MESSVSGKRIALGSVVLVVCLAIGAVYFTRNLGDLQNGAGRAKPTPLPSEQSPPLPIVTQPASMVGRVAITEASHPEESVTEIRTSADNAGDSIRTLWVNPLRERKVLRVAPYPGMKYRRSMVPDGPVDDAYIDRLARKDGYFNPDGVTLTPEEQTALRDGLEPLLADRKRAELHDSQTCTELLEAKHRMADYSMIYDPPFPSLNDLYELYKKPYPGRTWGTYYTHGKLAVVIVEPEEAPEMFRAKEAFAVACNRTVEYVFAFFENVVNARRSRAQRR